MLERAIELGLGTQSNSVSSSEMMSYDLCRDLVWSMC